MTQTMIACSRGRGCQTVKLPDAPLAYRIEQLLIRAHGGRFSASEICERLGLETGRSGEGWQNLARMCRELAMLEERHTISMALPNAKRPECVYWIDPPKEAAP
jgi:hypothetical protein